MPVRDIILLFFAVYFLDQAIRFCKKHPAVGVSVNKITTQLF